MNTIQEKLKSFTAKQKKGAVVAIVALILIILFVIITGQNKPLTDAEVITRVGALTQIPDPASDVPQIYTITSDPKTMPAFFKDAQIGDVTILFLQSQTAVIYSPSRNIIVNKGPIVSDTSSKPIPQIKATTTQATTTSTTTTQ